MNLLKCFGKHSLLGKIFVVLNIFDKFRKRLLSKVLFCVFFHCLLDLWNCRTFLLHVNCHLKIVVSKIRLVHSEKVLPLSVRVEIVSRVRLDFRIKLEETYKVVVLQAFKLFVFCLHLLLNLLDSCNFFLLLFNTLFLFLCSLLGH